MTASVKDTRCALPPAVCAYPSSLLTFTLRTSSPIGLHNIILVLVQINPSVLFPFFNQPLNKVICTDHKRCKPLMERILNHFQEPVVAKPVCFDKPLHDCFSNKTNRLSVMAAWILIKRAALKRWCKPCSRGNFAKKPNFFSSSCQHVKTYVKKAVKKLYL